MNESLSLVTEWKPCRVFPSEIHIVCMTWGRIFGKVAEATTKKAATRVWMSAEHWSAGRLRQETVSSQRLPVGDQSLTTWTAGAETAWEEKKGRKGGNIVFIFHRSSWTTAAVHHTSSSDTSSKITPVDFNKTMASLFAHVRTMLFMKKCVDKKTSCY